MDRADCGEVGPVRGGQPQALSLVVMDEEENMQDRPERGQFQWSRLIKEYFSLLTSADCACGQAGRETQRALGSGPGRKFSPGGAG